MRLSEIMHLVWVNIIGNRVKVLLTSLGIIVGSATIVLVIAIGRGGQMDVADQFRNLSAGAIDITYTGDAQPEADGSFSFAFGGGGRGGPATGMMMMSAMTIAGPGRNQNVLLSQSDLEDLQLFVPDLYAGSLSVTAKKPITGGNLSEAAEYNIAGVTAGFSQVSNLTMLLGEFITEEDDITTAKVAVLGYNLAIELFGDPMSAYDSVIYIDGRKYVINGVLDRMGTVSSGISPDDSIFIPYSSAKKYVMGRNLSPKITVVTDNVSAVPEAIENIRTVLNESYSNAGFEITDAGGKMEAAAASANTLSMLLLAVASIVFIVGGIGIMNVLFVSVQERTREIGILKALGCRRRDILLEFLAEANVISIMGGVVGVAISTALMPLMSYTGIRVEPSTSGILLALAFAVVTGTLFGFYPAKKASALVPIEALNME